MTGPSPPPLTALLTPCGRNSLQEKGSGQGLHAAVRRFTVSASVSLFLSSFPQKGIHQRGLGSLKNSGTRKAARDDHTKGSKSERQTPYDITHMWNLRYDTDELIFKAETDSQTQSEDVWLPRGRQVGEGWRGRLGLADANYDI